jgi:HAD superfamily phosphatase (TIGR01681 family)
MLGYIANLYNYIFNIKNNHNIFVFDLDNTITIEHTGGRYNSKYDNYKNYINEHMINNLIKLLKYIKRRGDKIYINSRGLLVSVYDLCCDIGIEKYIDGYYCAYDTKSAKHIQTVTCSKYDMDRKWEKIKTIYLNMICDYENVNKHNIYFFDDTSDNINVARNNGFINSFIVNSNNYPTTMGEYNLITILKRCMYTIYDYSEHVYF